MRIRLSELQDAFSNPRAFVKAQAKARTGFRSNRYLFLRAVALDYHKHYDRGISEARLESKFVQNFKSTKGNDEYLEKLREYIAEFTALGTSVAKVRNNVRLSLPAEYADFEITGQVARLDVDPAGGYRAWLLTNRTENWRDEVRFPVLQSACAAQLNVDVEEVVPGVYDFSTGSYTELRSSKREVQSATRKLWKLLAEIKGIR